MSRVIRFEADWLALREPIDAAARSPAVLRPLLDALGSRQALQACDLGSGTGSMIRFLAPRLGVPRQRWLAVEPDAALLARAPEVWKRAGWQLSESGTGFEARLDGVAVSVEPCPRALHQLDGPGAACDLVAAHAVADVVSVDDLARALRLLLRPGGLAYLGGTYAGATSFRSAEGETDPDEALVIERFHTSMDARPWVPGSQAARLVPEVLERAGLALLARDRADWRVGPEAAGFVGALLDMVERAAASWCLPGEGPRVAAWAARQRGLLKAGRLTLHAAHVDLLAAAPHESDGGTARRRDGESRLLTVSPSRHPALLDVCLDELLEGCGVPGRLARNGALRRVARPAVAGFAAEVAAFDARVGSHMLGVAARELTLRRSRSLAVAGAAETVSGPALYVANHPGMADAISIFATLGRDDLKIVANPNPFLAALPNLRRHLLFVPDGAAARGRLLRVVLEHFRRGGALLLFPGGAVETDPDLRRPGEPLLRPWSESVGLLVRRARRLEIPLRIVPVLVRGVLNAAAQHHPLARLRGDGQAQARVGINLQLALPARYPVDVRVAYGAPLLAAKLAGATPDSGAISWGLAQRVAGLVELPASAYRPVLA